MIALANLDWRPHSPAVIHPPPLPIEVCNRFGVYGWWPEEGEAWIHPGDVAIVRRMIPGNRVFRRHRPMGEFMCWSYGSICFRVKPTLCQVVAGDGFHIGDAVEILSRCGKNRPGLAYVAEMRWNKVHRRIDYYVRQREQVATKSYFAEDLRRSKLIASIHGEG